MTSVVSEDMARARKRRYLATRSLFIAATGILGLMESHNLSPLAPFLIAVGFVISNLILSLYLRPLAFVDDDIVSIILVIDIAMAPAIFVLVHASTEAFIAFFIALLAAAFIEHVATLAVVAGLVGAISAAFVDPRLGDWAYLRIPFLIVSAQYFRYVVASEGELERLREVYRRPAPVPQRGPVLADGDEAQLRVA
jgi:hypothetical protein